MWSMPVPGEEVILFVSFEKLYGFVVAICLSVFVCFVFLELNDLIIAYQALSTSELHSRPLFFHWRVSLWRLCWPAVCESLPFACHGLKSPGSVFCAYVSDSSWITFCVKNKIFTEAVFSMWISTHLRAIQCIKTAIVWIWNVSWRRTCWCLGARLCSWVMVEPLRGCSYLKT